MPAAITKQPGMLRYAIAAYGLASAGGTLAYQEAAPTAAAADALVDARLAAPLPIDANDFVYAWGSSRDYDAMPEFDKIAAPVLVVNSADDERNPPETGLTEAAVKRLKNGSLLLIPPSAETTGHLTTGSAKWYAQAVGELLAKTPVRGCKGGSEGEGPTYRKLKRLCRRTGRLLERLTETPHLPTTFASASARSRCVNGLARRTASTVSSGISE